jgi:hypothetical protein
MKTNTTETPFTDLLCAMLRALPDNYSPETDADFAAYVDEYDDLTLVNVLPADPWFDRLNAELTERAA